MFRWRFSTNQPACSMTSLASPMCLLRTGSTALVLLAGCMHRIGCGRWTCCVAKLRARWPRCSGATGYSTTSSCAGLACAALQPSGGSRAVCRQSFAQNCRRTPTASTPAWPCLKKTAGPRSSVSLAIHPGRGRRSTALPSPSTWAGIRAAPMPTFGSAQWWKNSVSARRRSCGRSTGPTRFPR